MSDRRPTSHEAEQFRGSERHERRGSWQAGLAMNARQAVKWMAGLVPAGALLLVASVFVADRQLEPPFDQAELGPIEIPIGEPLDAGSLLYASDQTGNLELYVSSDQGDVQALTNDARFDSWRPRLSPDRSTVLFYRTPAGVGDSDATQFTLWMVDAQGLSPVEVLPTLAHGWTRHGQADWSPSGDELVMMGERPSGYQVWITTADGRAARSVAGEPGDNTDPSWHPLGERILYVGCPQVPCEPADRELFTVLGSGGERTQLTNDEFADAQPRLSPSGDNIVMRTLIQAGDEDGNGEAWGLRAMPMNRSRPPQRLLGDGGSSSAAAWLDDRTVVFDWTPNGRQDADIMQLQLESATREVLVGTAANEVDPTS